MKQVGRFWSKPFIVLFVFLALSLPSAASASGGSSGFADLAEKLLPAVVNISTTQTLTPREGWEGVPELQFPPGSPFEEFFKEFLQRQPGQQSPRKRKASALGSGFIIDSSGYIVTNNHVIEGADEINVILQDDTNLPATIVGTDKKTDLALLKVTPKAPLTAVSFGDSNKVRVGDWILAIGNPYGFGGSVTAGIISARSRNINSGPYDEYLQTDASINRGNSGGPMFDMEGRVVGVNTAIISPSGGNVGLAFAIPSSLAKNIIEQLKAKGHIRRGWLGVRIQNVTQDIAEGLNLDKSRGALVASVTSDGPGAKAGIQPGDVILKFNGRDITEMHRLPLIVAETEVDAVVDVLVFRKGKTVTLKVKVGELTSKDDETLAEAGEGAPIPSAGVEKIDDLGASVAALSDSLRSRFGIKKGITGVVVTELTSDGLAADQGVLVGDVISEAAQKEVKSSKDLIESVKKAKKDKKPLLLLINRREDILFIAVPFGKKK